MWRHRGNETWIHRALDYQAQGKDLLIAGQTPLGELLAAQSAPLLEAVSACLLDCDDETRVVRLREPGPDWHSRSPGDIQDYLSWAAWMRGHANDPWWRPDVIRHPATEGQMRWDRWSRWRPGDPRWRVRVIDTSALPVQRVVEELALWVAEERALFRAGHHPLAGWAEGE